MVRLNTDLEFFAAELLKIRPKAGALAPFLFNPAQRELHRIIEEQKAKTGRVRVIVLKARQLGISTYIAARFYKQTTSNPGLRTIIIGHEKPASKNLFQLVKRFHEHMPEDLRPSVGASNAEELIFDKIDSGYLVSVATEEGSGRSATAQQLHASEAAFWKDLQVQFAALMQTIPDIDGTEIILETTGNSFNDFYKLWRKAEAGESEFIAVFLPWSLDPAYRARVPDDFARTEEEDKLAELHGLDDEQLQWRRNKIANMASPELFCQEYPLTADEAFIAADFDSYIPAELVLKARKREAEPTGYLIVGVDPAGKGADSTAIAWRKGSTIYKLEKRHGLGTMEVAGLVAKIIREEKPAKVNIDVTGLGVGVADRLDEQGYGHTINRVNFGGKPIEPPPLDENGKPAGGPANRRAELYVNLRNALEEGLSLPDSNSLQGDLTSIGYKFTSDGRLLLESKEDMRRRGIPSPDEGDAVALCFTEPNGSPVPQSVAKNFNRKIEYPNYGIF
ncbi:hypothetical protein [Bradyrhizobium sp. AZCC 1719]|uniref:hypothetical protein n=1 Tax=Bradyrhizobium sp. AZCC 1719 TaxID=3117028 RepID=UPI002FEEAE89